MSITYKATKRMNMIDPAQSARYYETAVSRGKRDIRMIAKEIAERTSLSTTNAVATLHALTEILPFFLGEGDIVSLGDFGSFTINLKSKGVLNEENLSKDTIKDFHLTKFSKFWLLIIAHSSFLVTTSTPLLYSFPK